MNTTDTSFDPGASSNGSVFSDVAFTIDTELMRRVRITSPSVIVGGHYSLADHMQESSSDGYAVDQSFRVGVLLSQEALAYGNDCHLVLWVDDIGIDTGVRDALKANHYLPDTYRAILAEADLDMDRLLVMFESTMRNKASTLLGKSIEREPELSDTLESSCHDLVRCVGAASCDITMQTATVAYTVEGPSQERLVVKEGPNPKCNLIFATFFADLRQRFRPRLLLNIINGIYAYRRGLGVHVAQTALDNPAPIIDVLCDGMNIHVSDSIADRRGPRRDCLWRGRGNCV